jgi:hypothetical protein
MDTCSSRSAGAAGSSVLTQALVATADPAEGVLRVKGPQVRARPGPYRSQPWTELANTSEVLKR